ncbi:MAG TPA: competence/damage-inducible protein A [Candidatus Acidoferrales bacterium]|nr:competence/damage-inducible protein A [Candidatus Acidoferrales bacterium]
MPGVELIAVGTEILLGQLVDTNTAFVGAGLAEIGVDVRATHVVGDNLERISATIRGALERADGVITTGGLGPTVDDLTKEAVCDALGVDTELYRPALDQMRAFFASVRREMRPNNVKQAELPRGSVPLPNPHGTAPGFVAFSPDGKFVGCMPGVPREMKPMFSERLVPLLRERLELHDAIYTRVIHTVHIGESEIDHRIDDLFRAGRNPKIAVLAHDARADVKVMAKAASASEACALIEPIAREIETRLEGFVFGRDAETLEGVVIERFAKAGKTLGVAESCTGGRIASALTAVAGASAAFVGGVIAYDNAVKVRELGVDPDTIERYGAVSEETAAAMATGARERLRCSAAVSATGIAGPAGGSPEKPVGLVWIGFDDGTAARAWRFVFRGGRAAIQTRATTMALGLVWKYG